MLPCGNTFWRLLIKCPLFDGLRELHHLLDVHIRLEQCTLEVFDQFFHCSPVNDGLSGKFSQSILQV